MTTRRVRRERLRLHEMNEACDLRVAPEMHEPCFGLFNRSELWNGGINPNPFIARHLAKFENKA